jgi:carotenoid cleavage dioxygenase
MATIGTRHPHSIPESRARTDPMLNPYLRGNFAPVRDERTDDVELPVTGVIPPDLDGRLLRNGPNPALIPADERDYHWLGGDGMVHAVSLAGGRATGYRNRWVRTRALAAKLETPPPPGPGEPIDGPANTHVIRHGGVTLALGGTGFPHALSSDLGRARIHDFDGQLASPMTAHPAVDPDTGELIFFGTDVFGPPFLRYHVADAAGTLVRTEAIEIPRATLMHDFGVTASRVVFLDLPVLFDLELATAGRPVPYRWWPDAGARVGVMPRRGGSADIRWIGIDPVYVSHVVNCYDRGDTVVMDVVRYDRAFDTGPGEVIASGLPALVRWTIDLDALRVTQQQLDDVPVELPRIDDRVAGSPHRYAYGTRLGDRPDNPTMRGLIKYDLGRDESTRFDPGEHRSPGEAVFVPAVDGRGEDEGWVLTVVYDVSRDASDLVILDATSFAGPPVATVHLPARVPYGLHGSWIPTDR